MIIGASSFPARAKLVASFVVLAMILGGGGSLNPWSELILQLLFAGFAIVWIWLPAPTGEAAERSWLFLVLLFIPLFAFAIQLIPLPPGLWSALPGREDQFAALSLVGEEKSWRPLSQSPARTIAGLLSLIPPLACAYAVSRLDLYDRRLVLAAVLLMAVLTALLGAAQLVSGKTGFNLYPVYSEGWVTGFQSNRNAAADVLLIGLLALATLSWPYLTGERRRSPRRFDGKGITLLSAALGLLLVAALIMTGSRAGLGLVAVPLCATLVLYLLGRPRKDCTLLAIGAMGAMILAMFAMFYVGYSENTAVGRAAARFWADPFSRWHVWQDTWFALERAWPAGVGFGGFQPAAFAAESLENVNPSYPNRAHNEYLELGLEAGLLGYVFLLAAIALLIVLVRQAWVRAPGMRRQLVIAISVLIVVALHSIVDYPLRNMSIACLAGVAVGMLVPKRPLTGHSFEQGDTR